jgi:hypothetical protein
MIGGLIVIGLGVFVFSSPLLWLIGIVIVIAAPVTAIISVVEQPTKEIEDTKEDEEE